MKSQFYTLFIKYWVQLIELNLLLGMERDIFLYG